MCVRVGSLPNASPMRWMYALFGVLSLSLAIIIARCSCHAPNRSLSHGFEMTVGATRDWHWKCVRKLSCIGSVLMNLKRQ